MVSIQFDDQTAKLLIDFARASNMSVDEYVRSLVLSFQQKPIPRQLTVEEFDRKLNELTFDGPSLPADFSRADIYDHDDHS